MYEHYTIDHRPQLTRQWNKCVKHCLELRLLPITYPTLVRGLTYIYPTCMGISMGDHVGFRRSVSSWKKTRMVKMVDFNKTIVEFR